MSDNTLQYFIFTESATHRLLTMKPSRGFDLSLNLTGVDCVQLSSREPLPPQRPLESSYDILTGFHAMPADSSKELSLLKRKVDTLLLVKTNVNLIKDEIRKSFSREAINAVPVEKEHFKKVWHFMLEERATALQMVNAFFSRFEKKIDGAASQDEVESHYKHLMENVNLGVYSATNQERKNLRP